MPQLNPYLSFDGRCAEAMRFYEHVLGGALRPMLRHSDAPGKWAGSVESGERVMHAQLELSEGAVLMAGDCPPGMPYTAMAGINVTLTYPTAAEAQRVFEKLGEGAAIGLPLQPTFWAEAFGMLTDRFGTPWIVNGALKA